MVLVLAIGGCVTDVAPLTQTFWEATLTGALEQPDIGGSAAAVSVGSSTQASISVEGVAAGTYRWGVFEGECAEPGDIVGSAGAYPELTVDQDGGASANAAFARAMSSGGRYFAQVSTGENVPVACGDFEPWQG